MSTVRVLGASALALGIAAPFAGSPNMGGSAKVDIEGLAAAIASGKDHVSALQLASWIRDKKTGLRVVDVRSPTDFAEFSIPSAENIPIAAIGRTQFNPDDTVVLYSEEGAHGAQAWVFLKAKGVERAYFIAGGLADWRDEVMGPILPADASPDATAAFQPIAELSRYFGGSPRTGPAGGNATGMTALSDSEAPPRARRRGC